MEFPPFMEKFAEEVLGQRNIALLGSEISRMPRPRGGNVMQDLQIELECRFRHDFGRGDIIFTSEKVFRRVKEYYLNKAARGEVEMSDTTSTDRSININRFYKLRETTMNGRDIAMLTLKNGFYTDYETGKYGTKLAASLEVSGSTARTMAESLLRKKEFRPTDTMNVRTKTRSSFIIHTAPGQSYSVDLTEVESYDVGFELVVKQDSSSSWLQDRGSPTTPMRRSYEIELDYTVKASPYRNIEDMAREVRPLLHDWCQFISNMAKEVVYQTNHLVGEDIIRDMFRNIKERMQDTNVRRPLDISKSTLPQVRNITTRELRNFANYTATPKADGVRSLIYFGRNYIAMIKPPTEFNILIQMDEGYESPLEGVLVDGEFVEMTNIKNLDVKKMYVHGAYYVFDVVAPSVRTGGDVQWKPDDVIERNNYLRTILPREFDKDAFEKGLMLNRLPAKAPIQGWSLYLSRVVKKAIYFQVKEYEDAPIHPYAAFRSYLEKVPSLQFKDDGLIFTPRNTPYHLLDEGMNIKTLKWKPVELMTIDFLYEGSSQDDNNQYKGTLKSSKNRELVPFVGTRFFPYDKNTPIYSDTYSLMSGAVYECAFLDGQFHVHRPRNDKEFPNTLEVAINDWYYINNPITPNIMAGHGYQPIQEYDKYRLWESMQHVMNTSTGKLKVLDLLNIDPRKDLPQEVCKAIDIQQFPEEFDKVELWTKVHLFSTNLRRELLPTQQDKLLMDVVDIANEYDLLILDGSMVQLILGEHRRYTDFLFMESAIPSDMIVSLRNLVSQFYTEGKQMIIHRMPVKSQEMVTTITYGSPDEKLIVGPVSDGSVQLLFANNIDRSIPLIYDPSIQAVNPKSQRIFCRSTPEFQFEAESGRSALHGVDLIPYFEWVRTGVLSEEEKIESLFTAVDGSGWMIRKPEEVLSISNASISDGTSGRFSMASSEEIFGSMSGGGIVAIPIPEGETPAEFLIDYDEIEPSVGSLEVMILKPILKRFSELPGKLPYNPSSALRYSREMSEITLRDQDYQFIMDEFDMGMFIIQSAKPSLAIMSAKVLAKPMNSRHGCRNGFIFIRRVDSGEYKLMIPSEKPNMTMENPYRMQHGMVAYDDPLLKFFIDREL